MDAGPAAGGGRRLSELRVNRKGDALARLLSCLTVNTGDMMAVGPAVVRQRNPWEGRQNRREQSRSALVIRGGAAGSHDF